MYRFDRATITTELQNLDNWRAAVFAASICERMMPPYREFARSCAFDDAPLRTALDAAWEAICAGVLFTEAQVARLEHLCDESAPDTEEFIHPLTSVALNTAVAVKLLVKYLAEQDLDYVVDIASLARDSIDLYVQEGDLLNPENQRREEQIAGHPLMQLELQRQAQDLFEMRGLTSAEAFERLSRKWHDTQTGIFNRSTG